MNLKMFKILQQYLLNIFSHYFGEVGHDFQAFITSQSLFSVSSSLLWRSWSLYQLSLSMVVFRMFTNDLVFFRGFFSVRLGLHAFTIQLLQFYPNMLEHFLHNSF